MQETTSLWECSSTLERKTLPQTFICRASFFFFFFLAFCFPYLLFISLQLEALARSTQSLEKTLAGRGVRLQEVIARSQTEGKNGLCRSLQPAAGIQRRARCCSCVLHLPVLHMAGWGPFWAQALDATDPTTGEKKGHFLNYGLVHLTWVCLFVWFCF